MVSETDNSATVDPSTSPLRQFPFALLRVAIGWHFLYEGLVKLFDPNWTAEGYLTSSSWVFSDFFAWLASDSMILQVVDQLNIWGLIVIGVCLMLGLLTRFAAIGGVGLLVLYYAAHPALFDTSVAGPAEGHYLIVNQNLVEAFALLVVCFSPASLFGIDGLVKGLASLVMRPRTEVTNATMRPGRFSRRKLLFSISGVPFVGVFVFAVLRKRGLNSYEEMVLNAQVKTSPDTTTMGKVDSISGATTKQFAFTKVEELKGDLPQGQIGDLKLSRVILGGNLIGGWAHARDLIYVSKLVKAYHHREKVFETLHLAESCGINTILTNPLLCDQINDYWKTTGGKINFISDCGGTDTLQLIQKSIDNGAAACYIQGGVADKLVDTEQFEVIEQSLELIRKNGLPAGIGAHKQNTIQTCVDRGYQADFWMKTLHVGSYWSANAETQHDNIWCEEPDETIAFMKERTEPWIAFKVLAAGAIHPKVGIKYAFQNGADFVCLGMYDFQMVDDVNIALDILDGNKLSRQREWYA